MDDYYGLTELEKNYNLHEYNHPLFDNMKGFMDSCWEINIDTKTVVMLYDTLHPENTGKQLDYEKVLADYGERHIYSLDRRDWYRIMGLASLVNLTKEISIDFHIIGSTGIPEICRYILTPAVRHDGVIEKIYVSSKNVESDLRMLREMQEQKQIIFAAMGITYPIIIYTNLTRNSYMAYMLSKHQLNVPMGGTYDSLVKLISDSLLPQYREDFVTMHSREGLKEKLREDGQFVEAEYEQELNGSIHWLESKTVRINNPYNSDFMAITLTSIIDEQRRKEYATKVAFQDAYHAALDAEKIKSEFLSRMSHEMLTPLNTIQCLVSLGYDNLDDPEYQRSLLTQINRAAFQLNTQLTRLLDTALFETETITLSETPADLTEELMNEAERIKEVADEKNIRLDVSTDGLEHSAVICDKKRVSQIFGALISNAVKFSRQGGTVEISLKEGRTRRSGFGFYEFTVKDYGIGIREQYLSRIFEPFERIDDNRVSTNRGSGLGLYIVRNISMLMGGNITAKSVYGEGSEFTATFFLRPVDAAPVEEPSETPCDDKLSFKGKRILVAEDNELNNELITELLRDMDFEVDSAYDGKEAADMLLASEENHYDIVLMDIMMPIENGYEATKRVRESGRPDLVNLPIIAASANSYPEDIELSLKSGMNDHLAKPIESRSLAKVLKQWLGGE